MQSFVEELPAHIHLSLRRLRLLTRRLAATFWICCNTAPWTLLNNLSFKKSAALCVVATPWMCWSHWWVNWSDGVIKQASDKRDRSTSNSYLINVNMKVSVSAISCMCSPPTHFLPLTSLSFIVWYRLGKKALILYSQVTWVRIIGIRKSVLVLQWLTRYPGAINQNLHFSIHFLEAITLCNIHWLLKSSFTGRNMYFLWIL